MNEENIKTVSVMKYELEAKTPYIHFQYDQSGATLRATEVKPKLDRFLKTYAAQELKTEFFQKNKESLNYKMRFCNLAKESTENLMIKPFKFYFANMGETKPKDFVFRDVSLSIVCANPELRVIIDKYIKAFFILHNFGARQTKGFGGFLVKGTTSQDEEKAFKMVNTVNFEFKTDLRLGVLEAFKKATTVYSVMKSGINGRADGFMLKHFFDGVRNDKSFMREQVLGDSKRSLDEYAFVRAILGLADHYDFRDQYFKGSITLINYEGAEYKAGEWTVPFESVDKNKGIKRFPSPITIKFFDKNVVFMLENDDAVYEPILGQPFFVLTKEQKNALSFAKNQQDVSNVLKNVKYIKTPDTFDRKDFVRKFVNYFNQNRQGGITLREVYND